CAFCAFSWLTHLPCHFFRLLFLTAFLAASFFAFLTGFLAAFTFTVFFSVLFVALFAGLFFTAFFAGRDAFLLARLAAFRIGAFAGFGIITVSSTGAGLASAASTSRQP